MTDTPAHRRRPAVRVGILSNGTSQFDSRAHRVARTLAAAGDTVTLYSRHRPGLAFEEQLDGYRLVRVPVSDGSLRQAAEDAGDAAGSQLTSFASERLSTITRGRRATEEARSRPVDRPPGPRGVLRRAARAPRVLARRVSRTVLPYWRTLKGRVADRLETFPVWQRFMWFPIWPMQRSRWFAEQVEPHDIWHGMWAASLPTLRQVHKRHGGRTVYDSRDVFLRARLFASMPTWQRAILSRIEGRWARQCDAVIQVSEPYAAMMERDLGLRDVAVVRNCPDRWDPPAPRPDRLRESLGIPAETSIVLYQGLLIADRGIEQAMDAILEVPGAVLVLMGFGNQNGSQTDLDAYRARAARPSHAGRVFIAPAVPPQELLTWTASADISIMLFQPTSENHDQVTPQKLWEAMAAGTPVLASDLPGFRTIVTETGCGRLVDPTDPAAVARVLREMLALGPDGLRAMGDQGLAAAHATYNWERQFEVLDGVYGRILAQPA
ncbi:MAG: glycosyltransferase [Candidatus Limnocylindrales bacterium]